MRINIKIPIVILAIVSLTSCAFNDIVSYAPTASESEMGVGRYIEIPSTTHSKGRKIFVETIQLEMNAKEVEILFRKEPHDKSKFPVTLIDNDNKISGKVSVKGSFSRNFLKKSLKIKLDSGLWRGHKTITLNAMAVDKAQMREWLAWDLIHALGMVAPEVSYKEVYINKKYVGLFLYIEWINAQLFDRYGLGSDGEFYHPDDSFFCGDLSIVTLGRLPECWFKLSPRDSDYGRLSQLVQVMSQVPDDEFHWFLSEYFDVDSVINWLVVNSVTGNTDSYNKNYFLYHSKIKNKWIVIPWDYDLSFGRVSDHGLSYPNNIYNDNFQLFFSPEAGMPSALKEKTLKNSVLYSRYKEQMAVVLGVGRTQRSSAAFGWFEPDGFAKRIDAMQSLVAENRGRETYLNTSAHEYERQVSALKHFNFFRYAYLDNLILGSTAFNTAKWLPYSSYPLLSQPDSYRNTKTKNLPNAPELTRQHTPLYLTAKSKIKPSTKEIVLMNNRLAVPLISVQVQSMRKLNNVEMHVAVETETPSSQVPPTVKQGQCVSRSWTVRMKGPESELNARLKFHYLQESSLHHEMGDKIKSENNLKLWLLKNNQWYRVNSIFNSLSNVFETDPINFLSDDVYYFVACAAET